jgi:hypothetical protein
MVDIQCFVESTLDQSITLGKKHDALRRIRVRALCGGQQLGSVQGLLPEFEILECCRLCIFGDFDLDSPAWVGSSKEKDDSEETEFKLQDKG